MKTARQKLYELNKLVQAEKSKLNKQAQTMNGAMKIFSEAKKLFGEREVTSLKDAIDFLASRRATQKYKAIKKNAWPDEYFRHKQAAKLGWQRRKEGRPTLAQLEKDWINAGYTKPTAKSMAILDDAIEKTEGHPGRGSLFPWSVRLLKSAAKRLGLKNRFICHAKELHKIAEKWQRIKRPSRLALVANLPKKYEVKPYRLIAMTGRHIKMATKVILPDGREIKFIDKLSKKEAIRQAQIILKRQSKNNPPRKAVLIYDNILSIEAAKGKKSLWPREKFRHDFKAKKGKAAIYGLQDGSLLIKGRKKLWKNFNYP